jgi:hypothetical protein
MSLAGRPAEGIPYLETAIRLNPDDIRGDIVTAYRPNTRTEKRILAK